MSGMPNAIPLPQMLSSLNSITPSVKSRPVRSVGLCICMIRGNFSSDVSRTGNLPDHRIRHSGHRGGSRATPSWLLEVATVSKQISPFQEFVRLSEYRFQNSKIFYSRLVPELALSPSDSLSTDSVEGPHIYRITLSARANTLGGIA